MSLVFLVEIAFTVTLEGTKFCDTKAKASGVVGAQRQGVVIDYPSLSYHTPVLCSLTLRSHVLA